MKVGLNVRLVGFPRQGSIYGGEGEASPPKTVFPEKN